MDRRRAAGALLALAACIASTHAAPTATSNHTALDLVDELSEGCYYNFQHYGEGDRIMTNEPCLNCTCHNRMLMCYLRVCPFTKAIGQDCTVEKRADQCCPIVTCPDVPVDLLTSTSTSSPAEYGGTGVGKVDKYGCSINGKYFPEGAKVPPTPNKPCEHCYCIRNMTTCVMQECTLHVDGCTPIYHKDVCCPVRYFCDHPEDEMPLLDDMTTTVRPTPGFLLTTIAPTEEPEITTLPARRDCIEDNQLYPDGALIKTEKPCEHCYCMKGDIVCVVQECGTPMENEGKNCTSLPPREGQCCPDTYICEGDEAGPEPTTMLPFEEIITTTVPSRRVSIEGSGYRNEDEIPYTEAPTFATELEGSGEEDFTEKPLKEPEGDLIDKFGPTVESEFIPKTTSPSILHESEIDTTATTEPDKGLNTVPSEDEESIKPSLYEQTTVVPEEPIATTVKQFEYTSTSATPEKDEVISKSTEPEVTSSAHELTKITEPSTFDEHTTVPGEIKKESGEPVTYELSTPVSYHTEEGEEIPERTTEEVEKATEPTSPIELEGLKPEEFTTEVSPLEVDKVTEPHVAGEQESEVTQSSVTETVSSTEVIQSTAQASESEKQTPEKESESYEPSIESTTVSELTSPDKQDEIHEDVDTRRTSPTDTFVTTTSEGIQSEQKTESPDYIKSTSQEKTDVTESSLSEQNTVPVSPDEEHSTESALSEKTTAKEEPSASTHVPIIVDEETEPSKQQESSESSIAEITTAKTAADIVPTEVTSKSDEEQIDAAVTELTSKKDEISTTVPTEEEIEQSTVHADQMSSSEQPSTIQTTIKDITTSLPEQHETDDTRRTTMVKETATETNMDLSTITHAIEKVTEITTALGGETSPLTEREENIETTTANFAENEIAEAPLPGRIPGEGDCLLEGVTYKNDSDVPSTNKCHSGCKCVSSIIKCNPIICSQPPEGMDNCQPRYDTPDACCPNYVCDHGMETIPPQPQSHITETESSTPLPAVECTDDQCNVKEETQPQGTDKPSFIECSGEECTKPSQIPSDCNDSSCKSPEIPVETFTDNLPAQEVDQVKPTKEVPQPCLDSENCKEGQVPAPCEGSSCNVDVKDEKCDSLTGCVIEPEIPPPKIIPDLCSGDSGCQPAKTPETPVSVCEGESCTPVTEECNSIECKHISSPPQSSQPGEVCSEEGGCKEPSACASGQCPEKDLENKFGCSGNECMQQEPILPTEEGVQAGSISTEIPITSTDIESETTRSPEIKEATTQRKEPQIDTEFPQEELTTSGLPEAITESVSDKSTYADIQPTKTPDQDISDEKLVTSQEEQVTESYTTGFTEVKTEKTSETLPPKDETEKPADEIMPVTESDTSIPALSQPHGTEETPAASDKTITEKEGSTTAPDTYDIETKLPEEKLEQPSTETVLAQEPEQTTKLPEVFEYTTKTSIDITEPGPESEEGVRPEIKQSTTKPEFLEPVTKFEDKMTMITESSVEISTAALGEDQIVTEKSTHPTIIEPEKAVTEDHNEEFQTKPPQRSGDEDFTSTTEVRESETKAPQTSTPEEKIPSTETPVQSTNADTIEPDRTTAVPAEEMQTEKASTMKDEETQTSVTESASTTAKAPTAESVTPASVEQTDESTTVIVDIMKQGENKETESPLSLVTKQSEYTTTSLPLSIDKETQTIIPETSTAKTEEKIPELEPYKPPSVSELPSVVQAESETPSTSTEEIATTKKSKTPEQITESLPEISSTIIPEASEPSATEPSATEPSATEPSATEPSATEPSATEPSVPVQVSESVTTEPQVYQETEPSIVQDRNTEEPNVKQPQYEKTTELSQSAEEEVKKTTIAPDATTQKSETATVVPQQDEKSTELPEAHTTEYEVETKSPETLTSETDKVTSEHALKEPTEKPVHDEIADTTAEIEQPQPEIPVSITESVISPSEEHEKATTQTPEREQETTEKPNEYVTLTESHETYPQDRDEKPLSVHEPQESSTEPSFINEAETKQPELEPTQDKDEKSDTTPQEETQTEPLEAHTTEKSDIMTPKPIETSSELQIVEVEKQTEEPSSIITEPVESTTSEYLKPTISDEQTSEEQQPTLVSATEIPEVTDKPEEQATIVETNPEIEEKQPELSTQTSPPIIEHSETTPFLVELEEHTHKIDEEEPITSTPEGFTMPPIETHETEQEPTDLAPSTEEKIETPESETEKPSSLITEEPLITTPAFYETEKSTESPLVDKYGAADVDEKDISTTTASQSIQDLSITQTPSVEAEKVETEKPQSVEEVPMQTTPKPFDVPVDTTAPEEEFIPVTAKVTTSKPEEEITTEAHLAKPEEKPSEALTPTSQPESVKPDELQPTDEVPSPEEEAQFPPSGGYNQEAEPDYVEEDQAFGPGTCRYGGKVYVSAQQIPRDDPCDFCFCFRSDIICLQQSCPPPIHGCHEEPIQGFCCPRYECPVSMATSLNVTTTTTTTTTTLPPHFLPHAYKGAAQRRGCQIKGHTYQVGEVVRASSGPCLHCTCGGDGQMKCDPKACTPEPMLRQMIAAAVSAKRRR